MRGMHRSAGLEQAAAGDRGRDKAEGGDWAGNSDKMSQFPPPFPQAFSFQEDELSRISPSYRPRRASIVEVSRKDMLDHRFLPPYRRTLAAPSGSHR